MLTTLGVTTTAKTNSMIMSAFYIPLLGFSSYFNFSWQTLAPLSTLLLIDYITGIVKVIVIDRENLKSYKAIAGILSKAMVILIPIIFFIAAKQVKYDLSTMVDTVITMLVMAEVYSIVGNIRSIIARKKVDEIDAVSFILKKISIMIENFLKKG